MLSLYSGVCAHAVNMNIYIMFKSLSFNCLLIFSVFRLFVFVVVNVLLQCPAYTAINQTFCHILYVF